MMVMAQSPDMLFGPPVLRRDSRILNERDFPLLGELHMSVDW